MRRHAIARSAQIALLATAVAFGCSTPEIDEKPAAAVSEPTATAPAARGSRTLRVDVGRSRIGFIGAKVTKSHEGGFETFEGEGSMDGDAPISARVKIHVATLWADDTRLASHLKSSDFFDVGNHPFATFETTRIESAGADGSYLMTGLLDLHGVQKEITFPATISVNDEGAVADAEFKINRHDWGISYPGRPDDLIKDDVAVTFHLVLVNGSAARSRSS